MNATAPFSVEKTLPAGGILVRLGVAHRPMTLTRATLGALGVALSAWEGSPGLRWVAFAAASPTTFLAGAHFRELGSLDAEGAYAFSAMGQNFFKRLRESPLWLVACVQGACMGGGLDFALNCDYRIASPAAKFSHPGPRLGLFTGWGGTATLPRRPGRAFAALLAGEVLSAREAFAAGWIEELAADPVQRAVTRAKLSSHLDLARVKRLNRAQELPLSVALDYERLLALEPSPKRDSMKLSGAGSGEQGAEP